MASLFARQDFNPSCPSGGSWYACGYGSKFVGCCTSDPCVKGCVAGDLEPASFDAAEYGTFPDEECEDGSLWYTCTGTSPPFMGCCKSNPCSSGCPSSDLTAGFLSNDEALAAPFSPSPSPGATTMISSTLSSISQTKTSASSASTSVHSSTGTSSSSSSTAAAAAQSNQASPQPSGPPISIIAGGAVAGVVVLSLLIAAFIWYCRKQTRESRRTMAESRHNSYQQRVMSAQYAKGTYADPKQPENQPLQGSMNDPIYPPTPYHDASPMPNQPPSYNSPASTYIFPSPPAPHHSNWQPFTGNDAGLGIGSGSQGWHASAIRGGDPHLRTMSPVAQTELNGEDIHHPHGHVELDAGGPNQRGGPRSYPQMGRW